MTVYTQISQNNWPSSKNQFDDYLVLNCPFNQKLGLTDTGVYAGSKFFRPAKAFLIQGNASISTTQSKYYGSSGYFDGTGDYLEATAASSDFAFGTGDFTIEFWAYKSTAGAAYEGPFGTGSDGNATGGLNLELSATRGFFLYLRTAGGSVPFPISYNVNPNDSTWRHWAVTRNGTTYRMFRDGIVVASNTDTAYDILANNPLKIGAYGGAGGPFNGYLQDFRVYKGLAKYTGNFTPPAPILGSA